MATNLPSCCSIQFLEQLLKFPVNITLLKYVKSQRSYDFLITKELIFGFQILNLKDHFSASLIEKIYEEFVSQNSRDQTFSSLYQGIRSSWVCYTGIQLYSKIITMNASQFNKLWLTIFNPIQAGVFWNHTGWGGGIVLPPPPPFLLYLWSNYSQTWRDGTLGQNLSKAIKILLTSSPGGKYNVIKPFLVSFQVKIRVPVSFVQWS